LRHARTRSSAARVGVPSLRACWDLGNWTGLLLELARTRDAVILTLGLPGLFATFGLHDLSLIPRVHRLVARPERVVRLSMHHGVAVWKLWAEPYRGFEGRSHWREGVVHLFDLLFGEAIYVSRTLDVAEVDIPLPEGSYPAMVTLNADSWTRPRAPFVRRILRAQIDPLIPIPLPSKANRPRDAELDAVHSLVTPARSVAEAIGKLITNVLTARARRASLDWRPPPRSAPAANDRVIPISRPTSPRPSRGDSAPKGGPRA
jgi:hypothetical protein